jgi:arylsulfatase A-like enzyme
MRRLVRILCVALLTAGFLRAAEPARPNILFIAVDDLNDWVGFLRGHPQTVTPNMDRLAARGVVFANAHCAAPLCSPSRAAVFSGRHPFHSGVYGNDDDIRRIAPKLVLLPQHLHANGYRTLGTGKLLHQKRPDLFDDSFTPEQRWSPFTPQQVNYTREELPSKPTANPRHVIKGSDGKPDVVLPLNRMPSERAPDRPAGESFDWGPIDVPDEAMGDAQIASWAVKQIQAATTDMPFFLGVGFYRPHIPLWAPAKYFRPFQADKIQLPPYLATDLDDLGATGRSVALDPVTAGSHAIVVKHDQWKPAIAAYLACVHFVDAQIGRVLDALDASPARDNTIIVLWGDHGWHLGEKQHWGKWTGWERAVRVPLAVVPPARERGKFRAGQTSQQPVSLLDLYPTLLELCRIAPPTGLDGQSLVPLLREPERTTGRAVVTTFYGEHFSVRDERWRYLRYADGSEELYDHAADPNEWRNVAGDSAHAAVKARLAREIPPRGERAAITSAPPAKGEAP